MAGPQRRDLRTYTGFLLRRAYVATVGVEASCLGDDARMREVAVLFILDEHGALSQREVAELTHISPTVMVGLVDSLGARGWVVRERKVEDRRSYALRLTGAGRAALRRATRDLDRSERRLTADLSEDEVARLRRHLSVLLGDDPALQVTALAERVGYLVRHAHRRSRERAQAALRQFDLHPRNFGLLSVVGRDEPCSQSHLAAVLGVSDPAVLPALEALETRGLLTRERNADDRRISDVRLTAEGRELLDGAQAQADAMQADIVQRLGVEANDDLRGLLARIVNG
ncbi:MarR family winged helix-turn-helix transcriptional regulator [Angustibacter luteus]|uniref:MarR family winged helix-turn-helix transcriptional regulator n=1 Tax=Angustibacter luteus TaxID=658456 RepID=A0ABW1JIM7_9ACTN